MLRIETHDGVTCVGGKASLLGTSIPVWVYLIDGLLVDTGPYALKKPLVEVFSEHSLERVVLTHRHEDHAGLAAWLEQELGVDVLAPPSAIAELAAPARLPLYRRLIWGRRPGFSAQPIPGEIETAGHRFRVIAAPGHTKEHIVLFEPDTGWLFSGDVFVRSTPVVAFAEEDMTELMRSLESLLRLDVTMLFCSHAGPLLEGHRALTEKLEKLEALRRRVGELRSDGLPDAQIASRLFPKKSLVEVVSRGEWSRRRLIETL